MDKVTLAKSAGFCFGVKRAVDLVYKEAEAGNEIYTFGPIIHNEEVVNDLKSKGVNVIETEDELKCLHDKTIIIRSHGVSRHIYDVIENNGNRIVDATCPFVKKIHKIVYEHSQNGETIIIIGNSTHPEVVGIKGWCLGKTHVISCAEDIKKIVIKNDEKVCVVAQTTYNFNKFEELVEILEKRVYDIIAVNTICNATEERQTEAKSLASESDAMIVIGGRQSSNTQKLFQICKDECDCTLFIQTINDLKLEELTSVRSVGITAGASTPNNIIEEVWQACQKKILQNY